MTTKQTPYSGPPLRVESWIEHGSSGNWLTGKGSVGNVAHIEISHDPLAELEWVKEYAAGRKVFRDNAVENARQFASLNKSAEAIVSSKIALEIPWQGGGFMYNQGIVVNAMGMEDYVDEDKTKRLSKGQDAGMEAVWAGLDRAIGAMQEAFDTPYAIKVELEAIAAQCRETIKGREVRTWTEAINFFSENGELLAASVSALELGSIYEQQKQPDEALDIYRAASELLKHYLEIVANKKNPIRHIAEVNELINHLITALSSTVRLYSAKGSVKGEDKEAVRAAVYELDDLGAPAVIVKKGYEFLAANARFKEKRFYKGEAAGIAGELAVARFFEENPGGALIGGPGPRRSRKHLRPPVTTAP
ncbi:hypothetical protein EOL96_05150 [Candidatus Saccharibacteria bacterium]|nr:hypothetical protein [Candidatus Saccharibacteria bacterium]